MKTFRFSRFTRWRKSHLAASARSRRCESRDGAVTVEVAVMFPIFLLFLFSLIEFGHLLMVKAALTSAAKEAARMGSIDDVSTAEVQAFIAQRMTTIFPNVNPIVSIKDASVFDGPSPPSGQVNIQSLPNIELTNAESRQMFAVELRVVYGEVAIFPPAWSQNSQLVGLSILRKE
ncbi:MAG: pilus assembly protein [Pirellulaceae bacterium]|jgi:Flp pilus assembly protein TadG|nr:pilus assembly protein [Pirellulaceae bacterium]